jgi:hypothetical protein
MTRIIILATATAALLGMSGATRAAIVKFTPAEGYVTGDANFQGVSASNASGDTFNVEATFTLLGNNENHTNNLQDFEEFAFTLNVTETSGPAPGGVLGAALAYEDDLDPDELQLRLVNNASGSISLGDASNYVGHTFTMLVKYTKLDTTNYSIEASIDSLDDAAPAFEVSDPLAAVTGEFSNASEVYGVIQAVPASLAPYSGLEVDEFKFDEPDLVPITPVVLSDAFVIKSFHYINDNVTLLQVSSNLLEDQWQDLAGSEVVGGFEEARYIFSSGNSTGDTVYTRVKFLP